MSWPKISVVTPNYNYAETLEQTMESVVSQKYPNLEYIVIDGGSDDGGQQIIEKHEKDLSYWVSEKDEGQYHAINKGMEKASGDILAWLNSDDIFFPWTLKVVARVFMKFPELEWIMGRPSKVQENAPMYISPTRPYPRNFIKAGLFRGETLGWIQQESVFWRRSLWEHAGPLNLRYRLAADYDLWIRFAQYAELATSSILWGGFSVRELNRGTVDYATYREEMDTIINELPKEDKDFRERLLKHHAWYQRAKNYTGIKGAMRRGLKLNRHTGPVIDWDFEKSEPRLNKKNFLFLT